jgi:hypothetical protein
VVEELAREAIVAQHVLALGESLGLAAVTCEQEAAARDVGAGSRRLFEERLGTQVVLAACRPDELRGRPADRLCHCEVGPARPEQHEAQA